MSINSVYNSRHQISFTPLPTILETEEPEDVQENNELAAQKKSEENVENISDYHFSEPLFLKNWLNKISDTETLYDNFIEALKKNSSLAIDLLQAPCINTMLLFSNESEPTIYHLLLNAIRHDQNEFVVTLARMFLESEEFITDTLESDEHQPKLMLFIFSMVLKKEATLSKLLNSEKFKKEKIDIEDLTLCLKFFSKHCEDMSLILNSSIMTLISQEALIDLLFINIFYSHIYSVFLLINSSLKIPSDMLCNLYFYALDLPRQEILIIFESQFNQLIESKRKELKDFLEKATDQQCEEKFSQAVDNRNTWIIHELLAFSNLNLSSRTLEDSLIKIASTPPKDKFTSYFTTYFFSQILNFTKNKRISNGKNGWGEALVKASKNGNEAIVKIILALPVASDIPLNDYGLYHAWFEADENEHQEIVAILRKFKNDKPKDSEDITEN